MSHISADDVRKVAQLARLDLPEDSIATFTPQLERILDFVAQLEAIDTDDTKAFRIAHVVSGPSLGTQHGQAKRIISYEELRFVSR